MPEAVLGGLLVVVVAGVGIVVLVEIRRRRRDAALLDLLSSFGPAVAAGRADPEQLVAWADVARTARSLFPDSFARLDAAAGGRFPFSRDLIEAAHARWTARWLAWERQHDLEYRRRTNEAESQPTQDAEEGDLRRQQLAAIAQEKLQTYQDRYEHYVRVGKAIAALNEDDRPSPDPDGR